MTTRKARKAALYLRTSHADRTTENQRRELRKAAKRAGWSIAAVYEDNGISGAKGRDGRPGFDQMLKDANRREFDVIMAWSVDRLGRSLQHLVSFLGDIHAKGVDLYLHRQGIDTTTPSGKAMFQMCGVFAEFESEMIRERINAGLARARERGTKSGRPIGRPKTVTPKLIRNVRRAREEGLSLRKIAKHAGTSLRTVQRVLESESVV